MCNPIVIHRRETPGAAQISRPPTFQSRRRPPPPPLLSYGELGHAVGHRATFI